MKYLLKNNSNSKQVSNLEEGCFNCVSKCFKESQIVKCPNSLKERRNGILSVENGNIFLCCDETTRTNRVFKEKQKVWQETYNGILIIESEVEETKKKEFDMLIHNLVSINTRSSQEIDKLIPQEGLGKGGRKQLEVIEDVLNKNPNKVASLILRMLKNVSLEKAEFTAYDIIYKGKKLELACRNIQKIIYLVFNTFLSDFNAKKINWIIDNCDEMVSVDYSLVSAGLTKIFDNITKYIIKESDFYIKFEKKENYVFVIMDMVSLKIKDDEVNTIFEEGVSGVYSHKTGKKGKGLGLYITKELFNKNDIDIKIINDVDKSKRKKVECIPYENNQIILKFQVC